MENEVIVSVTRGENNQLSVHFNGTKDDLILAIATMVFAAKGQGIPLLLVESAVHLMYESDFDQMRSMFHIKE